MFWRMTGLSAASPVESVLDKENFTLEELFDEEEIIQECKALNSRLINFLRGKAQVEQMLRYIVEEAPEDGERNRTFKFPFIACEVFTCEIDVILRTLAEEEELMNLLFSFLEPNRSHSSLLAGYFGKVVVCLMLRKTIPLMNYVQAHQDIFGKLVDLIGITSIMEVLVRLVGSDDHMYTNSMDVMQWLADSDLLEMIVDKLSPSYLPEVHANAAETLCAITRNAPSALAAKLSSPTFVARLLDHALDESQSKSTLVHSLSVCISLLDPRRSISGLSNHSFRNQHMYELTVPANAETIGAMLPKLGDLVLLLNVSLDGSVLPTTYGELQPPLGKHRLKIVEFIAILLRTGNEVAEKESVSSGAIQRILELFFEYPFHNLLHLQVENIIVSCLESKNSMVLEHLFQDCNLVGKIIAADRHPVLSCGSSKQPTIPAAGKSSPRAGNIGHITRIANKLIQLGSSNTHIQAYLQENGEWIDWQTNVLLERNTVENVYRWACGRPTALQDRTRDSDEEEPRDRDYDVAALANNLSQAFRYGVYDNDDTEEVHGSIERDDEDVYFDDESAEVVISSLRLGDDQESGCLFTNSNWFSFQDRIASEPLGISSSERMDDINLNGMMATTNCGGSSSSDDEVVVGVDEDLVDSATSSCVPAGIGFENGVPGNGPISGKDLNSTKGLSSNLENSSLSDDPSCPWTENDLFGARPDCVGWQDSSEFQIGRSDVNPFKQFDLDPSVHSGVVGPSVDSNVDSAPAAVSLSNGIVVPNGVVSVSDSGEGPVPKTNLSCTTVPSLFEEDVEFVGVELEGTERAMEQALKEGIVGEAGPLRRNLMVSPEKEKISGDDAGKLEFNDTNYWRVDQEVGVVQE